MAKKNIDPEFKDVYRINIIKFVVVVLIIGVIGCTAYYIYEMKLYEKVINYFKLEKDDEEKEDNNDYLKTIYYYKNGNNIKALDTKSEELELISSYACKTTNCNYKNIVDNKYGIIIDEKSYIYNIDKEEEILVNVDLKQNNNYMLIYNKDSLLGLLYKDDKTRYYSLDEGKVVYSTSTWDYYEDSNYSSYGYIAFKSSSSCSLFDLSSYKITDDSIHEGVYGYYDDMPVIKTNDNMYYILDKKLKPMNTEKKYIRYLNKKDYFYLMDGTKKYYKCGVENVSCSKKTATYAFFDLMNDQFIILYGNNMYFGNNTYTPTKKIVSMKGLKYDIEHSYYLAEKDGDKEPGYYLAFIKDGETKKYELYYFNVDLKLVSQESIDI